MDVVKRSFQALVVVFRSVPRPGQGSTFTMSLPLTLAVLDGMVVTVAGQTLVVPLTAIVETLQPESRCDPFLRCQPALDLIRNSFCPLVDVGRILNFRSIQANPVEGVALSWNRKVAATRLDGGCHPGFSVRWSSSRLSKTTRTFPGIAAATILGDGRVALILDVDAVVAASRGQSLRGDGALKSDMFSQQRVKCMSYAVKILFKVAGS